MLNLLEVLSCESESQHVLGALGPTSEFRGVADVHVGATLLLGVWFCARGLAVPPHGK